MSEPRFTIRPEVAAVIDTAAGLFGVQPEALFGRSRGRAVILARTVARAELRDRYGWRAAELRRLFERGYRR